MTGRLSRSTEPSVGGVSPERSRRSVVLPQPDRPTIERNSPCPTSKETSLSAGGAPGPNRFPSRTTRSSTGTATPGGRGSPLVTSAGLLTGRSEVPAEGLALDEEEER